MQSLLHLPNLYVSLLTVQLFHDSVEGHVRSLTFLANQLTLIYADPLVSVLFWRLLLCEIRKHLARACTDSE